MEPSIEDSARALLASDSSGRGPHWNALYERVAPLLVGWVALHLRGAMRERIDPGDITQDTWLRAMQSIETYSPDRGPFIAWLIGIARNTLRSAFAQIARQRESSGGTSALARLENQPEQITSITKRIARVDALSKLIETIREQDEADQVLVITCGLERESLAEAALRLDISVDAASKRWQRLRERLSTNSYVVKLLQGAGA